MNTLPLLSWDEGLEKMALSWVKTCPSKSASFEQMLYKEQGEAGIYLKKVANQAIVSWVNSNVNNKQLSWSSTERVGCGFNECIGSVLLGCVFVPPYRVS